MVPSFPNVSYRTIQWVSQTSYKCPLFVGAFSHMVAGFFLHLYDVTTLLIQGFPSWLKLQIPSILGEIPRFLPIGIHDSLAPPASISEIS